MDPKQQDDFITLLHARFATNMRRHEMVAWPDIEQALHNRRALLTTLAKMEETGGEPDVVLLGKEGLTGFADCSAETPTGRRSLCYDKAARDARKENKPKGSAMELAADIGITMLNEQQYHALQALGEFDLKTSSWVATPVDMRARGGALFCDRRFGRIFAYHNGAESYYAARGFRGFLAL